MYMLTCINRLSANPTKGLTNCLSVFEHFVGLALKGLTTDMSSSNMYELMQNIFHEFYSGSILFPVFI